MNIKIRSLGVAEVIIGLNQKNPIWLDKIDKLLEYLEAEKMEKA